MIPKGDSDREIVFVFDIYMDKLIKLNTNARVLIMLEYGTYEWFYYRIIS